MRLAFISDIHGNVAALHTVCRFAREAGVDRLYHLGDLIGRDGSDAVIRFVFEHGILGVLGQTDHAILRNIRDCGHTSSTYQLRAESLSYLKLLPPRREIHLERCMITIAHCHPASTDHRACCHIHAEQTHVLVTGASHVPLVNGNERHIHINAGSVGDPADGDPRSCIALLDINDRGIFPVIYRIGVNASFSDISPNTYVSPSAEMLVGTV